jgi:hypothetical protein
MFEYDKNAVLNIARRESPDLKKEIATVLSRVFSEGRVNIKYNKDTFYFQVENKNIDICVMPDIIKFPPKAQYQLEFLQDKNLKYIDEGLMKLKTFANLIN